MGTNLSFSRDLQNEIQGRNNLASPPLCRLSKRFVNHDLTIRTRIAVYFVVVISTIINGCNPCHRHIRPLESFHIIRLQLFLGLRWWHKVTHSEIMSRADIPSIESIILYRRLRWRASFSECLIADCRITCFIAN